MNLASLIRRRHGAPHWYIQRATAVLALPLILVLIKVAAVAIKESGSLFSVLSQVACSYPTLTFLVSALIAWHMKSGFESIFDDYIHDTTTKLISVIALRTTMLLILKYVYLFTISLS